MPRPGLDIVALEERYADPALKDLLVRQSDGPLAKALLASVEEHINRPDRLGIATEAVALAPQSKNGLPEQTRVSSLDCET